MATALMTGGFGLAPSALAERVPANIPTKTVILSTERTMMRLLVLISKTRRMPKAGEFELTALDT
jgi:hypothetical protein